MNASRHPLTVSTTVDAMGARRGLWRCAAVASLLAASFLGSPLLADDAGAAKPPVAPPTATPPGTTPPTTPPAARPDAPPPVDTGARRPDAPRPTITAPSRDDIEKRRAAAREALLQNPGKPVDPNLSPTINRPPGNITVSPPETAIATTESKVIRFEPAELDLGEMTADVSKTGNVKLINITDKPVTITRVVPSCGCTTAPAPKEPIPAGGSVEIPITLKPGSKQGTSLAKRVTFQIENEPPVVLNLKGHVAEYVRIEPELIASDPENPESGKVTLKALDGSPFKIIGVNPAIVTDYGPDAKTEHVVHIDWKKWEEAGSGVKVAFSIDHPKIAAVSGMIKRQLKPGDRTAVNPPVKADRPQAVDPGTAALISAAKSGDLAALESALKGGAKVDDADRASGRNALHWAAADARTEAIDALLKAGANINAEDRTGKSPLSVAAEKGKVESVRALVKAGAAINHRDRIQGSPVLWAAGLGNAETVRELIAAGADVNVADVNGLTPLLWASGIGDPASVVLLLDAKADVSAKDRLDGDDALMRAVRSGKDETVKTLLARGAKTDQRNDKGATALLVAAGNGSLDKVKMLVEAKSDITAKDNSGRTLADYAKNRIDPMKELVVTYVEQVLGVK